MHGFLFRIQLLAKAVKPPIRPVRNMEQTKGEGPQRTSPGKVRREGNAAGAREYRSGLRVDKEQSCEKKKKKQSRAGSFGGKMTLGDNRDVALFANVIIPVPIARTPIFPFWYFSMAAIRECNFPLAPIPWCAFSVS